MAYYLRKDKKKRGTYLQMYDRYWDKEKKQARSKSIQAFGYLEDLISDEMPDPLAYYEAYVHRKNEERAASIAEETRPRAFTFPVDYNLGHFLLHSLWKNWAFGKSLTSLHLKCAFNSASTT